MFMSEGLVQIGFKPSPVQFNFVSPFRKQGKIGMQVL